MTRKIRFSLFELGLKLFNILSSVGKIDHINFFKYDQAEVVELGSSSNYIFEKAKNCLDTGYHKQSNHKQSNHKVDE